MNLHDIERERDSFDSNQTLTFYYVPVYHCNIFLIAFGKSKRKRTREIANGMGGEGIEKEDAISTIMKLIRKSISLPFWIRNVHRFGCVLNISQSWETFFLFLSLFFSLLLSPSLTLVFSQRNKDGYRRKTTWKRITSACFTDPIDKHGNDNAVPSRFLDSLYWMNAIQTIWNGWFVAFERAQIDDQREYRFNQPTAFRIEVYSERPKGKLNVKHFNWFSPNSGKYQ